MGSCVSVHKHPESAMKLRLSIGSSKTDKIVIPSPVKQNPLLNGDRTAPDVGLKSQWSPLRSVPNFRDYGSKEETFFDSQPWLDSDCEDDFQSVNGDFTPSRGSTPVHPHHSLRSRFEERAVGFSSPTDKKKKLSDLLKESLGSDRDADKDNLSNMQNQNGGGKNETTTTTTTPYTNSNYSGYSSGERTPAREQLKPATTTEEEKSLRSSQCCIPRLRRSFSERKKKNSSPGRSSG